MTSPRPGTTPGQRLLLSLILGTCAATILVALAMHLREDEEGPELSYFGAPSRAPLAPLDLEPFRYENLKDDATIRAIDLQAHFEKVTLPDYHEAQRYTFDLLGLDLRTG